MVERFQLDYEQRGITEMHNEILSFGMECLLYLFVFCSFSLTKRPQVTKKLPLFSTENSTY